MIRRSIAALSLLLLIALSACAPPDPLVGTWRQTGTVADDGTVQSVLASESVVLELQQGGSATVSLPGSSTVAAEFTWETSRGLLVLRDHPGWAVRTAYELVYELEGDRFTTNWIDGPPRRVFERR